jgi:F-type H+-transporting ATPase subunit delta
VKKDLLASHRYAQALFELARAQGEDEYVESQLEALCAAFRADPTTERFLGNPALSTQAKRRVLERVFSGKKAEVDGLLVKFLLLLFEKNRFYLIHDVAAHFRKVADESQGQGVAEIRSAAPLKAGQRDAIVSGIERIAGKKMVVRTEVDVSLLGGVIVQVGHKIMDDSAHTKIANFKKELTKTQSI